MRAVPLKGARTPSSGRAPKTAPRPRRARRDSSLDGPSAGRAGLRAAQKGAETQPVAFALFDTPVGRCAIAWRGTHVVELHLPEGGDALSRARMLERFPGAEEGRPPRAVQRAIERVQALLRGERVELGEIDLDLDGVPPFHRRVYELARTIPPGVTIGYGELAERLGAPGAARAVGQALRRNPCAILVPCHRVLAAGGKVGGFTAAGGTATKLRLLELERGASQSQGPLFDGATALPFDPVAAVAHLRKADRELAKLIRAVGPLRMRLQSAPSVFAALTEAIIHQQLTARAAGTIHGRLRALFPRVADGPTPQQILRAADEELLAVGLSRAKLLSLRDLAERTKRKEIPTLEELGALDDEEIIERLTIVRGVGRWTVEMLLMFRLGRPDVLPVGDYGVRKGFARAFGLAELPSPKELEAHGERWRPYRTAASWYLWRALE